MNPFYDLTNYLYFPTIGYCVGFLDCLLYYAGKVANVLFVGVLVGGVIVILYSAFLFLIGSEQSVKKARQLIGWGIIGVIVGALSLVIVKVVLNTLLF